jgi:signal peptidase I
LTTALQRVQGEHDGLLALIRPVLEIVAVALFFLTFAVQPCRIPSSSMLPTLQVGDSLLMDKQSFAEEGHLHKLLPPTAIQRGDLVVFHFPIPDPTKPELQLVKRIVGLPGDRIRLREGRVLLNGQPLSEPYAFYSATQPNGFRDDFPSLREADPNVDPRWWITLRKTIVHGEIIVPTDQYFVLGDNRNDSEDSRYWGFVPQQDIVGRPLLVTFSAHTEGTWPHRLRLGLKRFRIVK